MDGVPTGNTWPRMTTGALDFLSPQFVNADQSANAQRGRAAIYGRVARYLMNGASAPRGNLSCESRKGGLRPSGLRIQHPGKLGMGTIIADAAGARKMKLFWKKLKKQDEKVLAEASDLATRKLEQYFADRRDLPSVTREAPKKSALTRLRWW